MVRFRLNHTMTEPHPIGLGILRPKPKTTKHEKFKPKNIIVSDVTGAERLKELVQNLDVEVLAGTEYLTAIAQHEQVDIVLNALVGAAGLKPALAAATCGKRLAIANKEPLVIAGQLLTKTASQNNSQMAVLHLNKVIILVK